MDRRKVLSYLVGVSFIAGLVNKTFRRKKSSSPLKKNHLLSSFVGTWTFVESAHSKQLVVDEEGQLFIDGKSLRGGLTSLHPTLFVYTDYYGYELTFQMKDNKELLLYDSADEKEYRLILQTPNI